MQSKRTEFTIRFAKLALSLMVASAVLAGTLNKEAFASGDFIVVEQPGTHEIVCICDNCNQDEPDDSDIEEALKLIDETEDAVVRPTPYGQG